MRRDDWAWEEELEETPPVVVMIYPPLTWLLVESVGMTTVDLSFSLFAGGSVGDGEKSERTIA